MMNTNIANPPPRYNSVSYWERSSDPFHPEAFADVIKIKSKQPRKDGWMAIDWIGNPIGFVADDSEVEQHNEKYILKESYPGRLCAVPEDSLEQFEKEKANRNNANVTQ